MAQAATAARHDADAVAADPLLAADRVRREEQDRQPLHSGDLRDRSLARSASRSSSG
jgi:hypothetical protein